MAALQIAVADSPFPSLDPIREVVSRIGGEVQLASEATPEAILRVAKDADAVLVTYGQITGDIIRQLTKSRIISRMGIGTDNIDIEAATKAGIVVTKVPDYCIDEVSDHTMALLLAVVRKIPFINAQVHGGTWKMPAVVPIHRLRGSVLGLMGFGRIPQLVAPKAKAFGLKVIAYDPYAPKEAFAGAGVESVDFPTLLKTSDYVSIHSPLVPETKHLFNGDAFRQMKGSAYLVNTARGPIIDEAALAAALDAGDIAGAALDVMEKEPPGAVSSLYGRDNVIITPHTSFYSEESLVDLQTKAAEEVLAVLSGKAPRNPVNPEVVQAGSKK